MLKNYFKIAWRNLQRNRLHTVINITGLSVGIAAALLIFIVIRYEMSYDSFQKNYNRIYRVVTNTIHSDGSEAFNPGIPVPAYDAIKNEFPQFEKMAAISANDGHQITVLGNDANQDVRQSKKLINEGYITFTQPDFFDIFTVQWIEGNGTALKDPENAILDRTTAIKYFGTAENVVGKYFKVDNAALFKVAGVIEDIPENSDFPVKVFASYEALKNYPDLFGYHAEWGALSSNYQLYVLLPENVSAQSFTSQLNEFSKKYYTRNNKQERTQMLQPLSDMHFNARYGTMGDHSTSRSILWTLALIGALIIVMASINFVNLATAQAVGRSKEVGIKKVLGSSRVQLVWQVMVETSLVVLLAALFALLMAVLALPWLHHIASVPKHISLITADTLLLTGVLILVLTLLSGIYPAMIVSGFKPVLALKNKISSATIGGVSLRRALVVLQFGISQMLIIGTIIAVSQMNYVRNADLGFNKEAVWVLPSFSDSISLQRINTLKLDLLKNPDVLSVSFASDEAASDNNWSGNFAFNNKGEDEAYPVFMKYGDADYVKTFGLEIIAGRNYQPSDTIREFIINESLVRKLGVNDPQEIVGKTLQLGQGNWYPIVGVVKDFKTNSLRDEMKPLAMSSQKDYSYIIAVKMRSENLASTTAAVQKLWEKSYPEYAFNAHFSEETIERFYRQETQLTRLYKIFAAIAIFISCLGLYGLVSYMAVQKTKEVGIRKVLGASAQSIVVMFSKEFTALIIIAFVISTPVAWFFMQKWLDNFSYRINIGVWVFAAAISASLLIAWITVGYRAIKAALANPVKSLRTE